MALPQRDDKIEEIKRLDALLEYAVMYGDKGTPHPSRPPTRFWNEKEELWNR